YTEESQELCEIIYGADIFPGTSVVDPNASLSMRAAAAHECSHFHRWRDTTELNHLTLRHIDEALTSLDAAQRYQSKLNETEIRQLIADAMQRLQLFVQEQEPAPSAGG
ncbi:MAG TPA: hypothetical protein VEW26_15435, partial [Allosphingosinicella sp.]|nr:hypothetical protein [Allosphingosinicella sp.]